MMNNIIKKINDEIGSLTALSIVNLIFGAVAIAIGVSNSVNQINLLKESVQISLNSIIFICLGIGLSIVGMYWLISSANILDFTTDIQLERHKKRASLTDEVIIGFIIQMIAFYRKNQKKIKLMILMSMIGGCLFLGFTLFSAINMIMKSSEDVAWSQYIQIIGLFLMLILGIACFFIPRFFKKYASIWDGRMKEVENAERTLLEQIRS